MKLRHSKKSSDDLDESDMAPAAPTTGGTSSDNNWKCPSCGAMNEDFRKFCDGCGDKRPGANVQTKGIAIDELLGSSSSDTSADTSSPSSQSLDDDSSSKKSKGKKGKKNKKSDEDDDTLEPERLESSTPEPEPFQPSTSSTNDDFESKPSDSYGSKPSFVSSGPEPTPTTNDSSNSNDSFSSFQPSTPSSSSSFGSGSTSSFGSSSPSASSSFSSTPSSDQHYYMVFVNTPAASLIKTRVAIEFGDFPTVSIGRSPENVIVIPDPEVSRKHASLSFDGNKLILKDLGSSNGSFIYDGKEFTRVSDSVEVRPNTVLKFGTGTIVKLVSE